MANTTGHVNIQNDSESVLPPLGHIPKHMIDEIIEEIGRIILSEPQMETTILVPWESKIAQINLTGK